MAFVWDANKGFPPVMLSMADVLYLEPPWKHGYNAFHEWAGVKPAVAWEAMMKRIGVGLAFISKPAIVVAGKTALKYLQPDTARPALLNGGRCYVAAWRRPVFDDAAIDTEDVIRSLAKSYNVVGDPACGYGRSGRLFVEAGKRYVMSDVSARCIGYIAAHEAGWGSPSGEVT